MKEMNQHNMPYSKSNVSTNGASSAAVIIILIVIIVGLGIFVLPNMIDSSNTPSGSGGTSIFATTNEKIAKETQKLIENDWRSRGIHATVVKDMLVTKKYGNEYSGMMTVSYEGKTFQLTGTILYDGYSIQWQPDVNNLMYQMF